MSFTGNLEHLALVDIIQLLHQTRKSGTLCLQSHKGESQLVFKEGFIVSANHPNNSLRIGHILMDMEAVTQEAVDMAISAQKEGGNRKPLIAILIENGQITKETAFKGLETLIKLTIVALLKWTEGTFTLEISSDVVSDEYRYFPDELNEELILDTQSVLMDALRIFDEKNREGSFEEEDWLSDAAVASVEPAMQGKDVGDLISAADLGLDNLENLERKIPEVFMSLRDEDPSEAHRRVLREELPNLEDTDREQLVSYLLSLEKRENGGREAGQGRAQAVILFSRDKLLKHVITAAGKRYGFFVFTTDEPENLDLIIGQTLSRSRQPVMVFDSPQFDGSAFDEERFPEMWRHAVASCHSLTIIQLHSGSDQKFALQALLGGVRAVFPLNMRDDGMEGITSFLEAFSAYMRQCRGSAERQVLPTLNEFILRIGTMTKAPDIALALLQLTASCFERTLTLVVKDDELIAERSFGIKADRNDGPTTTTLKFKIPLKDASPFLDVVTSGRLFFGPCENNILNDLLFTEIGPPLTSHILLLPLKRFGRVIALIYADFGQKTPFPAQLELLNIASRHASLTLETALYRAKMEKTQI